MINLLSLISRLKTCKPSAKIQIVVEVIRTYFHCFCFYIMLPTRAGIELHMVTLFITFVELLTLISVPYT